MLTKIYRIITCATIFLFSCLQSAFAQQDTTITMDKQQAKAFEEYLLYTSDSKFDQVPDFSKNAMVTDRPHIAETPHLVAKGFFQWETGFAFQQTRNAYQKTKELTYNTTLLRYGLSRRFELRVQLDYLGTALIKTPGDSVIQKNSGFAGLSLGSKVYLFQQNGLLPETSLLYGISLPYPGSKSFKPSYTCSEIKFLFVNRIARWYEFEYNLGVQWNGNSSNASYAYAFNNEFELTHKLFCFIELYGYLTENSGDNDRFDGTFTPDNRLNGGFWYMFTPNLQVDLSGGFGLSKASPDYYVAVGFSNRLRFKK